MRPVDLADDSDGGDSADNWPDDLLDDGIDREAAIEAGQLKRGYTVVEREEPCGKDACACTDDRDAWHGPYKYHVTTRIDGSRRWEYIGPAYDID